MPAGAHCSAIPIGSTVRSHLEDAVHCAALLRDAHLRTEPVTWLEELCERFEANLDGLRVAGRFAIDLAKDSIGDDPETASVLAMLVEAQEALTLLEQSSPDVRDWSWWGLRLTDCNHLETGLRELVQRGNGVSAFAAFDIHAFHRMAPTAELSPLAGKITDEEAWYFLEAAGRCQIPLSFEKLTSYLTHSEPRIRRAALGCAARRQLNGLVQFCRESAGQTYTANDEAIEFLGVLGSEEDVPLLEAAASRRPRAGAAVKALGTLGSPRAMPLLLDLLTNADLSESAASSIERITGERVPRGAPPMTPSDLTEEELDVWEPTRPIDAPAANRWWRAASSRFDSGQRWQYGYGVSTEPLRSETFDRLPLTVRYDVYLRERALGTQTPDWEMETWIGKQRNPGTKRNRRRNRWP